MLEKCPRCRLTAVLERAEVYFEVMKPKGSKVERGRWGQLEEVTMWKREEARDRVCGPCMVEVRAWASGQSKAKSIYTTSNRASFGTARMILSGGSSNRPAPKPKCKHGTQAHRHCYACEYGL